MKALLLLLIVLKVAAKSIETQTEEVRLPASCPKNPFQAELEKNSVSVFAEPAQYPGASCGDEWKRFGVCCREQDLVEYVEQDLKNITRATEAVIKTIEGLKRTFKKMRDQLLDASEQETKRLIPFHRAIINFIKSDEGNMFEEKWTALMNNFKFRSKMRHCWNHISAARSKALCSVCSGRSNEFFSGNKILMSGTYCDFLLNNCAASFKNMVFMLEIFGRFFARFQGSTKRFNRPALIAELDYVSHLIGTIEQETVQKDIKRYLSRQTSNSTDMKTAASLCSKFLNIEGLTFIEKVQAILNNLQLNSIPMFVSHIGKQVEEMRKNNTSSQLTEPAALGANFVVQGRGSEGRKLLDLGDQPLLNESSNHSAESTFELPARPKIRDLPRLEALFTGDTSIVIISPTPCKQNGSSDDSKETNSGPDYCIPFNSSNEFP